MKEARYKIAGHYWKVRFAEIADDKWADSDQYDPKSRDIRFQHNLPDQAIETQVEVVVHELLHVQDHALREEIVEERAKEISRVLCDQFTITEAE